MYQNKVKGLATKYATVKWTNGFGKLHIYDWQNKHECCCKRSNCRVPCHFGSPRAHVHLSGGCEDRGFDTIDAILNQRPVSKWQVILQFNLRASDVINDSDITWQKRVLIGSLLLCILRRRSNWCIACYRGVLFHWARTILPQNVNKFIENCTYYYL